MELLERQAQTLMDTAVDVAMVRRGDTEGRRENSPGILGLSLVVPWLCPSILRDLDSSPTSTHCVTLGPPPYCTMK